MTKDSDRISIEYKPFHLEYDDFIRCNNSCFFDEPISKAEFASFHGQEFWAVYKTDTLIGYGLAND